MAEESVVIDNKPTITTDPFDGSASPRMEFSKQEIPIVAEAPKPVIEPKVEEPAQQPEVPIITEDGRNYLKDKLGYEDWDAAKNEIETLKTKVKTFDENNQPVDVAKIKQLYATIDKKEKLEKLVSGEITKGNAADIIKTAMKEKHKLSDDQVKYRFNKLFGVPPKPIADNYLSDDDYQVAETEWQQKVSDAEMELIIEANMVRPELEKINSELQVPNLIKAEERTRELTPEDLAKIQQGRQLFIQDAAAELKKFEGFNTTYKDKDVEVQSSYKLSDEENKKVLGVIETLAANNYDANTIFNKRWGQDGQFSFSKMLKDLATLEAEDSRSQKYIGDAVAKAKIQFIKQKHNTDLDNGSNGTSLQLEDKERQKKSEDALWYN